MQTATTVPRQVSGMRADAVGNRERIINATREMFVEYGTDVSLDEVARRAGVGNAPRFTATSRTAPSWCGRSSSR